LDLPIVAAYIYGPMKYYNKKAAAKFLGISIRTMYNWRIQNVLRPEKVLTKHLYSQTQLLNVKNQIKKWKSK
jgi:DNA-binding transcriptional MerR regulator